MNDFTDDLAWSHAQSDADWWEDVYRQAFPNFLTMTHLPADGWAQRAGIDRLVTLTDGTVLKIDEKVRRSQWPDILLEYWSDERRRSPGWIAKPLTCDYIAYAFAPTQVCYLLPFQTLRRAWFVNRQEWVEAYRRIEAQNAGYVTVSVAVPVPVLLDALADAMTVKWEAA